MAASSHLSTCAATPVRMRSQCVAAMPEMQVGVDDRQIRFERRFRCCLGEELAVGRAGAPEDWLRVRLGRVHGFAQIKLSKLSKLSKAYARCRGDPARRCGVGEAMQTARDVRRPDTTCLHKRQSLPSARIMLSGNTSVPCVMISEKCADMVLADVAR